MVFLIVTQVIQGIASTDTVANIFITVRDQSTDEAAYNAKIYIIKISNDSINVVKESLAFSGISDSNQLSVGSYSVSAFHPNYGWGVKRINITANDLSKNIQVSIKLKPVATNYTDTNGNFYEKLMTWPMLQQQPSSEPSSNSSSSNIVMSFVPPPDSILLDVHEYEAYWAKIGEVYSTAGVSNQLTIKAKCNTDVKYSVNGGVLTTCGYTTRSSGSSVTMNPVADGQSYTVEGKFDFEYQLWYCREREDYFEAWQETHFYSTDIRYVSPYPSPGPIKPPNQVEFSINAENQAREVDINYGQTNGASYSIGTSITLGWDNWLFGSSVALGGTYSFSSQNEYNSVYHIEVNQGNAVWIYAFNNAGPQMSGTVLTFRNRHWADNAIGANLNGQGTVENAAFLEGSEHDQNWAHIIAPFDDDAACILASLNAPITNCHIYAYAKCEFGFQGNNLYCYVSPNGVDWYPTSANVQHIYDSNERYVDFGTYGGTVAYIGFAAYNNDNNPVNIMINAVHVINQ